MNIKEIIVSGIVLLLVIAGGVYLGNQASDNQTVPISLGNIGPDPYMSTTTSTVAGQFAAQTLLKTGQGTLGSVIITGAGAGQILLLDATTTNINLRAASKATSTIRLLDIPPSAAAEAFPVDTVFVDGLTVSIIGTQPTTTITWK